jgi:hypothetical protein
LLALFTVVWFCSLFLIALSRNIKNNLQQKVKETNIRTYTEEEIIKEKKLNYNRNLIIAIFSLKVSQQWQCADMREGATLLDQSRKFTRQRTNS